MNFFKMQGLGNDFVMVDAFHQELPEDLAGLARKACHRQFGIGADGLVLILPSHRADVRMRIFNPDGTEPEMCGNAIRCLAKYVYESGLTGKKRVQVETLAGIICPEIIGEKGRVTGIRVDMGEPRLAPARIPVLMAGAQVMEQPLEINGETLLISAVSMGNPHCLIFVDDVSRTPVASLGPQIETHAVFPAKTNVEFVQVINPHEVKVRVWERGAGETLACGTGASATVVACVLNHRTGREVTVHLPGGDLMLCWSDNNHVFMTGPAEKVFEGRYLGDGS